MKLILILILAYFLYLFLSRVFIPVFKAYRSIKKNQNQMFNQYKNQKQAQDDVHVKNKDGVEMRYRPSNGKSENKSDKDAGEYIDYEEVK